MSLSHALRVKRLHEASKDAESETAEEQYNERQKAKKEREKSPNPVLLWSTTAASFRRGRDLM